MNIGKESEILEFKSSTGEMHQAMESIVAILNKHGEGELYFGVNDDGEAIGQMVSDSTIRDISDAILRDIDPKITPSVFLVKYDGKDVIKVSFSGNQKPYSAFGKFLIRIGTQNRHITGSEMLSYAQKSNYSLPWDREKTNHGLADIDGDSLRKYYEEAVNCGRLNPFEYDEERLLTMLELYEDGKLNNAGYALFGNNPGIGLKVACFATDEKLTFTDLNVMKGNIYTLKNEASTYIMNHINWRSEIGLKRVEIPEIPIEAIREIVSNAFAHALYQPTPEIEINIHPGKITIYSPGSFPYGLNPLDFVNRDIASVKRNPLILDILYRCKDVEKTGTGFKRVNRLCEENGIRWDYESSSYGFYFTFFRNSSNVAAQQIPTTGDLPNLMERSVYNEIVNNNKITKADLAKKLERSLRSIQRTTSSLEKKGYIIRIGNGSYGYWVVTPKKMI